MKNSIIVAVDEINNKNFYKILDCLDPNKCMIKIGSVAFNAMGHEIVSHVARKGFNVFLDLKLHDIPNTIRKSIEGLISLPISMITIHISGGLKMMKTAKESVKNTDIKIFGVTALTSLSDDDTNIIFKRTASEHVEAMLNLAEEAQIDGVVCSPHELNLVTARKSLKSITPGIRLVESNDDQNRVMTPKNAILNGADYIVVGRPITNAPNISEALQEIHNSIKHL